MSQHRRLHFNLLQRRADGVRLHRRDGVKQLCEALVDTIYAQQADSVAHIGVVKQPRHASQAKQCFPAARPSNRGLQRVHRDIEQRAVQQHVDLDASRDAVIPRRYQERHVALVQRRL